MSEAQATIELPEGTPEAVSHAGSSLSRVAGGFESAGSVVSRASAAVGSWEGQASVSFQGRAMSYGIAAVAVEQTLTAARGAVQRYETALEQARERIRSLRNQEEETLRRLELARRRLADANDRAAAAQEWMTAATFTVGLGTEPFALAEQAQAQGDADQAQADASSAQGQIERLLDELQELRRDAGREQTELDEAEDRAASAVRAAANGLPDIELPGGATSPSAYAGTPFGPALMPERMRGWMEAGRREEAREAREDAAEQERVLREHANPFSHAILEDGTVLKGADAEVHIRANAKGLSLEEAASMPGVFGAVAGMALGVRQASQGKYGAALVSFATSGRVPVRPVARGAVRTPRGAPPPPGKRFQFRVDESGQGKLVELDEHGKVIDERGPLKREELKATQPDPAEVRRGYETDKDKWEGVKGSTKTQRRRALLDLTGNVLDGMEP